MSTLNETALNKESMARAKDAEDLEFESWKERDKRIMANVSHAAGGNVGSRFGQFRYNCTHIATYIGAGNVVMVDSILTEEEKVFPTFAKAFAWTTYNADKIYEALAEEAMRVAELDDDDE